MYRNMKCFRVMAVLAALLLIVSAVSLTACKKKETEGEKPVTYESVAGKCYVFSGMSADDEEYDEDLLKEMFDIDDLSEYLAIKFGEDDKALLHAMTYGDEPVECVWSEEDGKVDIDMGQLGEMTLSMGQDGVLSTVMIEDDDEEFLIKLVKTDDVPEVLSEAKE